MTVNMIFAYTVILSLLRPLSNSQMEAFLLLGKYSVHQTDQPKTLVESARLLLEMLALDLFLFRILKTLFSTTWLARL